MDGVIGFQQGVPGIIKKSGIPSQDLVSSALVLKLGSMSAEPSLKRDFRQRDLEPIGLEKQKVAYRNCGSLLFVAKSCWIQCATFSAHF